MRCRKEPKPWRVTGNLLISVRMTETRGKGRITCAEAARARAARMNFMIFVLFGKGKRFGW